AGNEIAGIFYFVAEVDDAVPAVVGVDRGLHAEEHGSDERGSSGDGHGGGGENFRVGAAAHGEAGNHHHEEDEAFEDGGEVLHFAGHGDTFSLQQGEDPEGGDANDFDARGAVEHREKMRE